MITAKQVKKGTLLSQRVVAEGEDRHYLFEVDRITDTDLPNKPKGFWQSKGIVSIDGLEWMQVPNEEYHFEGAHEESENLNLVSIEEWEIWDDYFRK